MRIRITDWIHKVLDGCIKEGDLCVDATMGKGNDTLFLCEKTGSCGSVFAFDIQEEAVEKTREKLEKNGFKANLLLEGHENMEQYIEFESVSCIMFNLGYLPGGDHTLATKPETSIRGIRSGLDLLRTGGIMSVCIYSGGDSGFEEKDKVLEFLKGLDEKKYFVIKQDFMNRQHHPPIPVFIFKL